MAEIIMTGKANGKYKQDTGKRAIVDDLVYPTVSRISWSLHPLGYAHASIYMSDGTRKRQTMHRFIFQLAYGMIPEGRELDHINRNKLDNRLSNLRAVTSSVNQINKPARNKSGIKGLDAVKRGNNYYWRFVATRDGVIIAQKYFPFTEDGRQAAILMSEKTYQLEV